ncbi:putative F-box protein At4g22030 [Silene latifolia]|uniref:putative F-box protein At4g22030 n=1 Tax=Silene latifolia TaxID=37657 RepID=UPI003D7782EE
MISLQACKTVISHSNVTVLQRKLRIKSVNLPTILLQKLPNLDLNKNVVIEDFNGVKATQLRDSSRKVVTKEVVDEETMKLYAILEAISDRIEMHRNVKEQRENWNSLLLNSINMITLMAATMAGVSTMGEGNLALKVSSMVLFSAATGLVSIMNKIQPSQLAQEQRNAVRLFKQLKNEVKTTISLGKKCRKQVTEYMEKVLALDRAYPLPLLGAMIEKFPDTCKPAVWWPSRKTSFLRRNKSVVKLSSFGSNNGWNNGWSNELEDEMRVIVEVIEKKDASDYVRLGNAALKLNKTLAVMGPLLTGIAAMGSGFALNGGPWGAVMAVVAGSLASVVNTIQHGGQVGMVFEMYRNCGGFFEHLEEEIESNLEEGDFERRENGELFEIKMCLKLGRSLSELRDLADKSRISNEGFRNEFASKLF